MVTKTIIAAALFFGGASLASATLLDIGQIVLDLKPAQNQQITIYNFTGAAPTGCGVPVAGADFTLCDAVSLIDWQLTVDYTVGVNNFQISTNFAAEGAIAPSAGGFGFGFIPAFSSPDYPFSYCSGGTCPPFDVTVTKIVFKGSVDSSPLFNVSPDGVSTVATSFTPVPFSVTFFPDAPAFPGFYSSSQEILLSDQKPIPEPGSAGLVLAAIALVLTRQRALP